MQRDEHTNAAAASLIRRFEEPAFDFAGRSVLVTGGTGSFGRAFVEAVLAGPAPRKLIVFSRDEQKQYEMAQRWDQAAHPCLRWFIGDVRDVDRLEMAMRDVDIVVHAAALKHVSVAEYNPFECVKTNVHGAENVVTAALRTRVQRVIALSTDKAANPVSLYGASKLAADKIFIAANNLRGTDGATFSVVRYGNVLGSRGSVVPYFQRLITEGAADLPITDPRMTRFWITIGQGVAFVISSLAMMQGGEVFVPKIPSMNIVELARALAPGLPQRIVGIRPGEKLHEAMIPEDEARSTLELADRYVVIPGHPGFDVAPYRALGAAPVPDAFRYSSDDNAEWLDADALRRLLGSAA